MQKEVIERYFHIFLIFLPISIIIGPAISLINVLLLNILILLVIFKKNFFDFFNNYSLRLIFILYFYLIFNISISLDYNEGLIRNLGFLRMIFLFIGINYFFYFYEKNNKFLNYWTIIILIFIGDIFLERYSGTNLFGWGANEINGVPQVYGDRVLSFFKDEPVSGAFLSGFIFLIFGNLLSKNYNKFIPIIFLIVGFTAILITGERSNTLKILTGIFIYLFFVDTINIKIKILFCFLLLATVFLIINQSEYLKVRYQNQIIDKINSKEKIINYYNTNNYIKLYKSGYTVFKNNPFFGVGNKNYRVETCKSSNRSNNFYKCTTHPHQIYIEFLSEHGLIGTVILLSIFFYLIFRILRIILKSKNYLQLGAFTYVLINFIPIIPSGSFFGDFNLTIFWINFSIMFACNQKSNIFKKVN